MRQTDIPSSWSEVVDGRRDHGTSAGPVHGSGLRCRETATGEGGVPPGSGLWTRRRPPGRLRLSFRRLLMRYGMNPHQPATMTALDGSPFTVVSGVPSYINVLDALTGWQLVREASGAFGATGGGVVQARISCRGGAGRQRGRCLPACSRCRSQVVVRRLRCRLASGRRGARRGAQACRVGRDHRARVRRGRGRDVGGEEAWELSGAGGGPGVRAAGGGGARVLRTAVDSAAGRRTADS